MLFRSCTNFLDVENHVGLPENKHIGRLDGAGHKTGRRELQVDDSGRRADFESANFVALKHIQVVDPWLEKHKNFIEKKYIERGQHRTDVEIIKEHNATFTRCSNATF